MIYPVGSVYYSINSTSPAELIGGTWTQASGAVLGLAGDNDFASGGSYGGSLQILESNMPPHSHRTNAEDVVLNRNTGQVFNITSEPGSSTVLAQDYLITNSVGGGRIICLIISQYIAGIALLNLFGGGIDGIC